MSRGFVFLGAFFSCLVAAATWVGALDLRLGRDWDANAFFDGSVKKKGLLPVYAPTQRLLDPAPPKPGATEREKKDSWQEEQWRKRLEESLNLKASPAPRYLLGETLGRRTMAAMDPFYGVVEGISDNVFNLLRLHFFAFILPPRLEKNLKGPPDKHSLEMFDRKFHEKELRFLQRLHDTYPGRSRRYGDSIDTAALKQWREWAWEEQMSVFIEAAKDTFMERYGLQAFGRQAVDYARDRRNWDPATMALAGTVGAVFLYFNGLHTEAKLGDLKLGIDLRPGNRIRSAFSSDGNLERIGGLEIRYADLPVSVQTDWSLDSGQIRNHFYGARFQRAF